MTRKTFCALEDMSMAMYYKLKAKGLTPKEMTAPGSNLHRISAQARRDWQRMMEAYTETQGAKLEAERRRELNKVAAKKAVTSPDHPANVKRAKKKRAA